MAMTPSNDDADINSLPPPIPLTVSFTAPEGNAPPTALPKRVRGHRRSASAGCLPMALREHDDPHFRITYQDDALCQLSQDNMHRLLRAASANDAKPDNNTRLAKKALQYRRLLGRAQAVDVEDPNFDLNAFVHITWCKSTPENESK